MQLKYNYALETEKNLYCMPLQENPVYIHKALSLMNNFHEHIYVRNWL